MRIAKKGKGNKEKKRIHFTLRFYLIVRKQYEIQIKTPRINHA